MRPELVLSEEEKKIRFKKHHAKRQQTLPLVVKLEEPPLIDSSYNEVEALLEEVKQEPRNDPQVEKALACQIRRAYSSANAHSRSAHAAVINALMQLHGSSHTNIAGFNFSSLASFLSVEFDTFANQLKWTAVLPKQAVNIYTAIIVGRYFSAESGADQLAWMLGENVRKTNPQAKYIFIPLQSLSEVFSSDMAKMITLCYQLRLYGCLRPDHRPLLASLTLASYSQNGPPVKDILCAEAGVTGMPPPITEGAWKEIKQTASALADLLMANIAPETARQELPLPYTTEERSWLNTFLIKFSVAVRSIPLGDDLTREYALLTTAGGAIPRSFLTRSLKVFKERFRAVLRLHPTYCALAVVDQALIWKINGRKATILQMLRLETMAELGAGRGGEEQMR